MSEAGKKAGGVAITVSGDGQPGWTSASHDCPKCGARVRADLPPGPSPRSKEVTCAKCGTGLTISVDA